MFPEGKTGIAQPLVGFLCMFFSLFSSRVTSNTPTIQTYPFSLELWQAWDEVLFWALILFHGELVPGDLALTHKRIEPLGTRSQLKQRASESTVPVTPSVSQQLTLGQTSCKHHQLLSQPVPMDFHGPLDVVGSTVLSLSSPTQQLGTAGGCCFRLVNHYKMLVMFCLSRGKKIKYRKKKSGLGLKQLWT